MTAKEEILYFLRMLSVRSISIAGDSGRTLIGVKSPYHQGYIDELKAAIPHRDREWDPTDRLWWISGGYYNTILNLISKHYDIPIQSYNHVENFRDLPPKATPPKKYNKNLNKNIIAAIDEVVKNGEYIDDAVDVIEIVMDTWKDGLMDDNTTLETIYKLIKN